MTAPIHSQNNEIPMAHVYTAEIVWTRDGQDFPSNRYSRRHTWRFDGGNEVVASSSPLVVPVPMSAADAVDPEEALVASLSACHMLFFLSFAARKKFVIDRYEDHASGEMGKNAAGRNAMVKVTLKPMITFSGEKTPTAEELAELHHKAHDECYIANSVNFPVDVEAA